MCDIFSRLYKVEMSPFLLGESLLALPRIKYTEFNISFKNEKFSVNLKVHQNVKSAKLLLNNRMSKGVSLAKDDNSISLFLIFHLRSNPNKPKIIFLRLCMKIFINYIVYPLTNFLWSVILKVKDIWFLSIPSLLMGPK